MSSVATDSNDGHELNLRENGFHFFKSLKTSFALVNFVSFAGAFCFC